MSDEVFSFNELFQGSVLSKPEDGRSAPINSDELVIRQARIHKLCGSELVKDYRIQVQVFPEQSGIPDSELDNLPEYPPFFQGTFSAGDPGDMVWVLCTPDLSQGYVLGHLEIFTSAGASIKGRSYDYTQIRNYLTQRKACPIDFLYKDIVVVHAETSSDPALAFGGGGFVELYNRKTGDWFLLNTTGSMLTVQQSRIYMRVGSPNPANSSCYSAIDITSDSITFDTLHFTIPTIGKRQNSKGEDDDQSIELGGGTQPVIWANASAADTGKNGVGLAPSTMVFTS